MLPVLLCVLTFWGSVAVADSDYSLAIENRIQIPKDAPYGLGAVLLSFDGRESAVLLPGRVIQVRGQGITINKAVLQTKRLADGSFVRMALPKKCLVGVKWWRQELLITGVYQKGGIEKASCNFQPLE